MAAPETDGLIAWHDAAAVAVVVVWRCLSEEKWVNERWSFFALQENSVCTITLRLTLLAAFKDHEGSFEFTELLESVLNIGICWTFLGREEETGCECDEIGAKSFFTEKRVVDVVSSFSLVVSMGWLHRSLQNHRNKWDSSRLVF